MSSRTLLELVFIVGALALPAHAQAPSEGAVAIVSELSGNVLVSLGTSLSSVEEGDAVAPGSRVLVTTASRVTLEFADGCRVHLEAGQRYEVPPEPPCGQGMPRIEWIEGLR